MSAPRGCDGAAECTGKVIIGIDGKRLCWYHWKLVEPTAQTGGKDAA